MARDAVSLRALLDGGEIRRASGGPVRAGAPGAWQLGELSGRLVELSGCGASATLTYAMVMVQQAQRAGEPVAWIGAGPETFYPPDAAALGVELAALPVIRVSDATWAARVAEHLARSGGFGLLVLDLGPEPEMSTAIQARLVRFAQQYDLAVLCLTEKSRESPSLGSLVSLRAEVTRERVGEGRFRCTLRVLKDKIRGPGGALTEMWTGPPGLG